MVNNLEWVTDNINIQHFILIHSSNCSDDHFYFSLKIVQFSPVPDTPFQQFMNYVKPCLKKLNEFKSTFILSKGVMLFL